jgi:RNA polymerase sigma factor (sigma-70 family)
MDRADEDALVRQLSRYNDGAWRRFYAEFWPPLVEGVRQRFGCDVRKAEEIVQSTFVRCIRSIRTFDTSRGRLWDWLQAVAANEARTYLKRESRVWRNVGGAAGDPLPLAELVEHIDRQPLPDELLVRRDTQTLVAECLLQLPLRQRQALVLKYQESLKVDEIAARLGLSSKAVESLLSRGRESFRRALAAKAAVLELTLDDMQL